jgi:hypothetical protein
MSKSRNGVACDHDNDEGPGHVEPEAKRTEAKSTATLRYRRGEESPPTALHHLQSFSKPLHLSFFLIVAIIG